MGKSACSVKDICLNLHKTLTKRADSHEHKKEESRTVMREQFQPCEQETCGKGLFLEFTIERCVAVLAFRTERHANTESEEAGGQAGEDVPACKQGSLLSRIFFLATLGASIKCSRMLSNMPTCTYQKRVRLY